MADSQDDTPFEIDWFSRRTWRICAVFSLRYFMSLLLVVLFVHWLLQPGGDRFKEIFTGAIEIYILSRVTKAWGASDPIEGIEFFDFIRGNFPERLFFVIWFIGMALGTSFCLRRIGEWLDPDPRPGHALAFVTIGSAVYGTSLLRVVLQQQDAGGAAVDCILSVAARDKADAIVMGHRGLRDIDAMTFGSVSNKVSRLATCDVVMIKSPGAQLP